jgi:hypothetical protein
MKHTAHLRMLFIFLPALLLAGTVVPLWGADDVSAAPRCVVSLNGAWRCEPALKWEDDAISFHDPARKGWIAEPGECQCFTLAAP